MCIRDRSVRCLAPSVPPMGRSRSQSWMRSQQGWGTLISAASPGPLSCTVAPACRMAQRTSPFRREASAH
eukprot:5970230-Prorocentrum_lima.AAC.1